MAIKVDVGRFPQIVIISAVIIVVILYGGYEFFRMGALIDKTKQLIAETVPYESATGTVTILVLGDSTGVGVGASAPQDSIAGQLGSSLDAKVENYAVAGDVVTDLSGQLSEAKEAHYDLIVVQIGANDVIDFHSIPQVDTRLLAFLTRARSYSDHIVLMTAGRIGDAPFFPLVLRLLMNYRARELQEAFMATAAQTDVVYVDFSGTASDVFASDPSKYYAADGLHPSSIGYETLFGGIRDAIQQAWPQRYIKAMYD